MARLAAEFAVRRVLPTLAVLRYVAPALVLAGMLLLDSHWLSDLVAGVAVGVGLLAVLHLIFDGQLGRLDP